MYYMHYHTLHTKFYIYNIKIAKHSNHSKWNKTYAYETKFKSTYSA